MNLKSLLIGCLLTAFSVSLYSQNSADLNPCGTQDGKVPWLISYQKNKPDFERSFETLLVPIKLHVVGDDNGSGYFNVDNLLDAFCRLNADYQPSNIEFFISGDLDYIDNDNFYEHSFQQGAQMMNQNNADDVINCYVVADPAGNCGYSNYSRGIALAKGCLGPGDHTWAHEVGHFLSLPHTFFGWEGTSADHDYLEEAPLFVGGEAVEKMDGSNCNNAADGFCDTAPDYLSFRWPCNGDSLSNQIQADPDSVTFRSDGSLFMSYANDNCSGRFSDEQIDAMRANINFERSYLLGQMDPLDPIGDAVLAPISPFEDETVEQFDDVLFEWEPVANATAYSLEISPLPSFALVQFRYHVSGTSFVSNDLSADRNYYWRIRPYSPQYTCKELSNVASFSTGILSSVQSIKEVDNLTVYPNPVGGDQSLRVALDVNESMQLEVKMVAVTGKTIQSSIWEVAGGRNQIILSTSDLAAGVYFLQLRSNNGVITRKIFKN